MKQEDGVQRENERKRKSKKGRAGENITVEGAEGQYRKRLQKTYKLGWKILS